MKAGATKEEARAELREIEKKIDQRTFMHDKRVPLFADVKKQWLEYKQTRCRETAWEMYAGHCGVDVKERKKALLRPLKNHFADLDGKRINRITTATIEAFITAKQGENITIRTLRKLLVTLNQIMAYPSGIG